MDVVCGRCRAEYEFDDALISERGTTVRCTNCGLQFKVFPPVGQSAPEMWSVFDPANAEVPIAEFESLSALQRAIGAKKVSARHLLARGEAQPRPLAEIVELQPLLGQPASEPPPPGPRQRTGTVLGMQTRPDPAGPRADPPPRFDDEPPDAAAETSEDGRPSDETPRDSDDVDSQAIVPAAPDLSEDPAELAQAVPQGDDVDPETAVVPSEPPEPSSTSDALALEALDAPAKPRIRSALSLSPHEEEAPGSVGVHSHRPPLSQTLAGRGSSPRSDRRSSVPPSSGRAAPPPSSGRTPAPLPEVEPRPRTEPSPGLPPSSRRGAEQAPATSRAPESVGGQLTPTPLGMRAFTSADSEAAEPIPEAPARRRATGLVLIVSLVIGGASVAAWSQRDRLAAGAQESAGDRPEDVNLGAAVVQALQDAEVRWWRARLDGEASGPEPSELQDLAARIDEAGGGTSWAMVNVQRMLGNLAEARKVAASLPQGEGASYALATIDLSEEGQPPWPLVLERLKEASAGERAPFLARVGTVFGLLEAGDQARARAEFEALGRLAGARDAALYEPLRRLLREGGQGDAVAGEADAVQPPAREEPQGPSGSTEESSAASAEAAVEKAGATSERSGATAASPESESGDKDERAQEEPEPARPRVSNALKQRVAEADALWRGGDRDGAVAIYRQVVAQIGTSHFLGQRSAARVALAKREKAAAAQRSTSEAPE